MARAPRVRRRWRLGFWLRLAVVILWPFLTVFTKRDWQGGENLEADGGGVIVAPNHISWFDPLPICHILWEYDRPPRFLAKQALFRVPVVGRIIAGAGQIPVYRQTRDAVASVRAAIAAVQAGEAVVIYPEGTITRDPDLWPMSGKTGAARVALATGRPVIPLAHWGDQQIMRPYAKEFRILPRKTIHMRVGRPVPLDDLMDRPMDAETLRVATDRILAAITELLEEIRGESAPPERYVWRPATTEGSST